MNSKLKVKKIKPKDNNPWFNKECFETKKKISALGKQLRNSPDDTITRNEILDLKRAFKNLVKRKKKVHQQALVDKLTSNREKTKIFLANFEQTKPQKTK